jgi:hypothetical protein
VRRGEGLEGDEGGEAVEVPEFGLVEISGDVAVVFVVGEPVHGEVLRGGFFVGVE